MKSRDALHGNRLGLEAVDRHENGGGDAQRDHHFKQGDAPLVIPSSGIPMENHIGRGASGVMTSFTIKWVCFHRPQLTAVFTVI
jgi:hypothetical protein